MGIFKWKTARKTERIEAAALIHLIERVEALERRWKAVELEWDDTYDRFRRLHAKLARRDQVEGEASGQIPKGGRNGPENLWSPARITNPAALALLSGRHVPGG